MTFVEWIASSGTQYIDTGLKAGADKRIVLTGRCLSSSPSDQTIIGGQSGGANSCIFLGYNWSSSYNGYYFNWSGSWIDLRNYADTLQHTWDITIKTGQQTIIRDNVTIHSTTQSISVGTPSDALMLFRRNNGSSPASFELHSMQIYAADGELLRDFIPALNDSDQAGLYDQVTGYFYGNAGTGEFTHGDPVGEFFTVVFDAAGGEGEMSAQLIPVDTPTALDVCAFTREEYMFSGWTLEPGGPAEFADGETVENLAESGETVTLYAVWQAEPMSIVLQYNKTDRDHLDKDLETLRTLHGTFREDCDITDPVIILEGGPELLNGCNYFTIRALGRSYFPTGYRTIRTGLIELIGHVDVLSSFKTQIRQQTAIVRRAESSRAYNLYLNDGSLHVYADPYILTEPFPAGFTSPSFVLAVAGSANT